MKSQNAKQKKKLANFTLNCNNLKNGSECTTFLFSAIGNEDQLAV